tara:strand:- start:479 stop:682 length:204 start_codon:yes stop_codon:yes gene_type:complete
MTYTPEQLEKLGYTVVWGNEPFATVIGVQCPKCGNAVAGYAKRSDENERIDGYDHGGYFLCDSCPEQ